MLCGLIHAMIMSCMRGLTTDSPLNMHGFEDFYQNMPLPDPLYFVLYGTYSLFCDTPFCKGLFTVRKVTIW